MEITDTNNSSLFPLGNYRFTICEVPVKKKNESGKVFYKFEFTVALPDGIEKYSETFMSWNCRELLRAIGAKETSPNVFEWDREAVIGKEIQAEIVHEADKKGKLWARLKNITEPLPF